MSGMARKRFRKAAREMEDDGGAWVNEGAKVAEFLTWFTSEPGRGSLEEHGDDIFTQCWMS